jgi:hypothetical protein
LIFIFLPRVSHTVSEATNGARGPLTLRLSPGH